MPDTRLTPSSVVFYTGSEIEREGTRWSMKSERQPAKSDGG